MNTMGVSVRDFLGYSYNHGDYITVYNNRELNQVLWEGKYETMDNCMSDDIANLDVVKWGIEKNCLVIFVDYVKYDLL